MKEPLLPDGWAREEIRGCGVVLEWPGRGYVTVDEGLRGFTLGRCPVYSRGNYSGRGWKEQLYADAIKALHGVFEKEGV